MTRRKTTSTLYNNRRRDYKCSAQEEEQKLDEEKFLTELRKTIYPILDIPTWVNAVFTNSEIFDIVAKAGIRNTFIEDTTHSITRRHRDKVIPNADTVYYRLKKLSTEEWIQRWEKANHKMLKKAKKQHLIPAMPSLSVDIHPVMFYGNKKTPGVFGCKSFKGSNYAFQYLTGCLSDCDAHLTLEAMPLIKGVNLWDALELLLITALQYVDHNFLLYMDREFYSTPVINLCEKYGQKYLMIAKKTDPVKKLIKEHEAPCVLPYTIHGKYGTAETTLVFVKNEKGKVKAFATNLNVDASQAEALFKKYKNRWTVDTSYRMLGEVRMNSKSLNYSVRWFLFFFSILMKNSYWLFNGFLEEYNDHVTLVTFTEIFIEVTGALFENNEGQRGMG